MIKGFIKNTILAGAVATAAFAGQITGQQIKVGTGTGGVNGLTGNFTGGYMNSAANCIGAQVAQANFTGCTAPVITGSGQRTYAPFLWQGTTPVQVGPNGETSGLQVTGADAITYAMVNNGTTTCTAANDGGCNFWSLSNNQSLKIPIGVFGVTAAHVMLNDYWGATGAVNEHVFLDFNTASDGSGTTTTRTYDLTNGTEIRSATNCSAGSGSCTTVARTTSSANTALVFTSAYTNNTLSTSPYFGTSGSVNLDAISFAVSIGDQSLWLADIRVSNTGGSLNVSRGALTAITLETSSTPEPSTILLLLGGFGVLGAARLRARKSA